MLGHWRIVLRQAEESARAGRFDEALALAGRPDVADHRRVVELRDRPGPGPDRPRLPPRRGRRRGRGDRRPRPGRTLRRPARRPGRRPPERGRPGRRGGPRRPRRGRPRAGRPRVDELAKHKVGGPALRRAREAAEAWRRPSTRPGGANTAGPSISSTAPTASRAGGRLAALAAARRDLEARQKAAHPKVERLYAALAAGRWTETLAAAEAVLETIAEHPAARQARTLAWQHIGAISPSAAAPLPDRRPSAAPAASPVRAEGEAIRFLPDDGPARPRFAPDGASPRPPLAARPLKPGPGRPVPAVGRRHRRVSCLHGRRNPPRPRRPRRPGRRPPARRRGPAATPRSSATATATSSGPTPRRS